MKISLPLITALALSLGALSPALAGNHGGRGMDDNPGLGREDNPGRHKGPRPQLTRNLLGFQTMVGGTPPSSAARIPSAASPAVTSPGCSKGPRGSYGTTAS